MQDKTLHYLMEGVFLTIIAGFLITSFFLAREIVRTKGHDRTEKIFKIEVALLIICSVGFLGCLGSYLLLL